MRIYSNYDRKKNRKAGYFEYCPRCGARLKPVKSGRQTRPTCLDCGFIQFRNPAPAVGVFVVDGDSILLGKRTENPGAGKWSIPSGYIEYDEDYLSAAIREVKEETGFNVKIRSVLEVASVFLSPEHHLLTIYLLGQVVGGELSAGDDLTDVGWFSLSGPLPPLAFRQDTEMIRKLLYRK